MHHIKVNTFIQENSPATSPPVDVAHRGASDDHDHGGPSRDNYEVVELPVTVTQGNVKMIWKILCSVPNTQGFVSYRPTTSLGESLATYIQSSICLHPNDYSEIEVKAQNPGLYVLQLRALR